MAGIGAFPRGSFSIAGVSAVDQMKTFIDPRANVHT
jgi:hypothetical protein